MSPKPSYFIGKCVKSTVEAHPATSFKELADSVLETPITLSITYDEFWKLPAKHERDEAKRVSYVVACTFPKSPWTEGRKLAHAGPCDLLFLDIDELPDGNCPAASFVKKPSLLHDRLGQFNFIAWKTASHRPEKPRLRVMVDADGIPVEDYPDAVLTIAQRMELSHVTRESAVAVQPMFLPTVFKDHDDLIHGTPLVAKHFNGRAFNLEDIAEDLESLPGMVSGSRPSRVKSTGDVVEDFLLSCKQPDLNFTLDMARDALRCVSPSRPRADWFDIAAALRHQFPGEQATEAFETFHDWSSLGDNYAGRADCETLWRSLKEELKDRPPIAIGTLIMRAKKGGWKYPALSLASNGAENNTADLPLPPICCAADLITEERIKPRPQQLVQGLVHIGEKLLLAGASKSYKSWALLDLACSVGTGTPFWGLPTTKGSVLLLNYEIRPWFFANRLEQVAKAKGCGTLHNVYVWNLRGKRADFGRMLLELKTLLKSTGFVMVIIDPLYSGLAGRSENDAAEMAALMNSLEELAELGPAVALGHHFAKGNSAMRESLDRASGSGVFARDPDGIVTLNRHQTDEAFVAEFTLRNFAPMAPRGLRLNFPLLLPDASLDVGKIKGAQVRSKTAVTVEAIVALLPKSGGIKTSAWQKLAHDETGVSSSRFYVLRKEAESRGLFRNEGGLNERPQSTPQPLLPEYSEE